MGYAGLLKLERSLVVSWNYFISHASEDKRLVAAPLAHYFSSTGFSVWYDDFSLKVGDSILAGINTGLAESAYGIVILSPSFFKKAWPQRELAGLMAQMTGVERRILPVWHEITSAEVTRAAPLLADIKAVSTSRGLNAVAEEIVRASFPDRVASMPTSNSETRSSQTSPRRKRRYGTCSRAARAGKMCSW